MTDGMTIAVTGATGFVGRHICRELVGRGYTVRALARDPAKASRVLPESTAIVTGDIHDDAAVAEAVDGAFACVHLIGIIREAGSGQSFERMHVGATQQIVEACEAAGVKRFVHMSALGAGPEGASTYAKTKFEAERIVRGSELDWTIFRPGLIHGEDGEFFEMMKGWVTGRRAPWLFLPYFTRVEQDGVPGPANPPRVVAPTVAPVHVDDVAKAFADAIDTPASAGEVFPLAGPELITWPDMLRLVRDVLPQAKKELKAIGLPGPIAAAKAKVAKWVGLGWALPFDAGMALMGSKDSYADVTKARAVLGFEPRGFEESLRGYAG